MDRKAIAAFLVVGLVATMAGAGLYAYFSDIETSTGNTFTAGTLNLEIRDQDEPFGDGVTATWTATGIKPGDKFAFQMPFISFRNVGTISAGSIEITCDYAIDENGNLEPETNWSNSPEDFAKQMIITGMIYYDNDWRFNLLTGGKIEGGEVQVVGDAWTVVGGNVVGQDDKWKIEDKDNDGKITFHDLKLDAVTELTPPNGETKFVMSVQFNESAGNDFQGDTFNLTMIFTLKQ